MKSLVIEHDNGIRGQHGFSDEEIFLESEIKNAIKSYEDHGIIVYGYIIFEQ